MILHGTKYVCDVCGSDAEGEIQGDGDDQVWVLPLGWRTGDED